jgi:anaerobic magnesium-protoporphyrin IX monomethyl ester cyclase
MRIKIAYVGSSLSAYGFRLLTSILRQKFPETACRFVMFFNLRSITKLISPVSSSVELTDQDADTIAKELSECDVLGIASMSEHAAPVKMIIAAVRKVNPKVFIVWGGVHPIMHPDDAIPHADAICVSEAETAFPEFLEKFDSDQDYAATKSFWFRRGDKIIKNGFAQLLSSEELDALPLPVYGEDELIYEVGSDGFVPLSYQHYLDYDALSYNTVWTRGCPYRCTYCGNTRFLEIDKAFGKLRHSSVEHLIAEIRAATDKMPHISSIGFHDDCFIGLPPEKLQEFSDKMKLEIGLPFAIYGVTPADIRKEKIEILLGGGLNRVRMGVQSGSDKILKFYKRPNRAGFVKQAIDTLGLFADRMMPPTYDMIFDNPIETTEDIEATLRLIYDMPRPYALNIFSLRYIPNTELGRQLASLDIEVEGIDKNYVTVKPTFANALMYTVALVKLPRPLFEYLLRLAKPYRESAHIPRHVITFLRILYMVKRGYFHLRWADFSVVFGRLGWMLKRHGLLTGSYRIHDRSGMAQPLGLDVPSARLFHADEVIK